MNHFELKISFGALDQTFVDELDDLREIEGIDEEELCFSLDRDPDSPLSLGELGAMIVETNLALHALVDANDSLSFKEGASLHTAVTDAEKGSVVLTIGAILSAYSGASTLAMAMTQNAAYDLAKMLATRVALAIGKLRSDDVGADKIFKISIDVPSNVQISVKESHGRVRVYIGSTDISPAQKPGRWPEQ